MPITDESAEMACDWLRDNAKKAGELRGARIRAEEMRKHIKAVLMAQSTAKSAVDREAEAYGHARYFEHLATIEKAVIADEENRAMREAAALRIEVWRSLSANLRGKL